MSLLDTKNEYVGDLPNPLVPEPTDMHLIDDVFYCGMLPSNRWRSWINAAKEWWDPRDTHDKLLASRNYCARMLYETSIVVSTIPSEWLSVSSIEMIRDVAHCEFRVSELKIITFQLTCGMIGIKSKKRVELYHCAVKIFTSIVSLGTMVFEGFNKNNKSFEKLMSHRPLPSDKKAVLAKKIDRGLHTLKEFVDNGAPILRQVQQEGYIKQLGENLRDIILALDDILHVV